MKRLTISLFVSVFLILLSLCSSVHAQLQKDIFGTLDKGKYINNYLKFEVSIPEGWVVADSEGKNAATQIGLDGMKTGNSRADALIEKSVKTDTIILMASEKPIGAMENAAFAMSITNLPSKGYTPRILAETFKSTFLKNPKNKLTGDVDVQVIGGKRWANVQMDLEAFGKAIHSSYFVTVIGDKALVASMSYQTREQLQKMEDSFRGIKFTAK